MARHIMAVCVVCLLCADHLPCQQHVETLLSSGVGLATSDGVWEHSPLNAIVYNRDGTVSSAKPTNAAADGSTISYVTTNSDDRRRRRRKRHADHGHNHASSDTTDSPKRPEITEAFVKRIFNEYGTGDTINVQDFQRMLEKIGLHELLPQTLHNNDDNETVSKHLYK